MTARMCRTLRLTAMIALLMISPILADTVTTKGLILSTDSKARKISVKRLTPKGEKTGEFVVSKEASISIRGEFAIFYQIQSGQWASLTYDTSTNEIVSINIDPTNSKPTSSAETEKQSGNSGIIDRLKGTKWENENKIPFEWDLDGKFSHHGHPVLCVPVDANRVAIVFANSHVDVLVFDGNLEKFEQWNSTQKDSPLFRGRRTSKSKPSK